MSELLSIIPLDDGYTESAYVAAFPNVHGAHRIKYRPLTHHERFVVGNALGTKPPAQASQVLAATLAKQIKDWDVCAANGGTLPVNASSMAMLKPNLIERFYAIVSGRDGGDPDPDAAPDSDALDKELQAILEDRLAADVQAEGDLKN